MDWFKKHTDAIIFLSGLLAALAWLNGEFAQARKDEAAQFNRVNTELSELKNDLTIIKTVLMLKGIIPDALAREEK